MHIYIYTCIDIYIYAYIYLSLSLSLSLSLLFSNYIGGNLKFGLFGLFGAGEGISAGQSFEHCEVSFMTPPSGRLFKALFLGPKSKTYGF